MRRIRRGVAVGTVRALSDQTWAVLIGAAVVAGLRLLDALLPKGYHLRLAERFLVKGDDDDDPADEQD